VGNLTSLQTLEVDLDKITQPPMEVNVQVSALSKSQRPCLLSLSLSLLLAPLSISCCSLSLSLSDLSFRQGCAAMVRYLAQIHAALKTLHLHVPSLGLVAFPPELINTMALPCPQAAKLISVSLTCNKLETIPACMSALTSVQKLDLSRNLLTRISVTLGAMLALRTLDLSGMPTLRLLDLSGAFWNYHRDD